MGGGVPFCMLAIYQTGIHSLLLPDSSSTPQGQKGIELGQKVAKVNFSLVCFGVLSGILETKKGKSEIYFGFGAFVVALSLGRWWCPLVAYVPDSGPAGPAIGRLWSSGGVFHAFCPLSCFACGALPLNMALFRVLRGFLARFGVRMYVCIGLGALR